MRPQHISLAAILAIACAIASFFVHSGILGVLLAILAILFGLIGILISFSPRTRGGVMSFIAVIVAVIGVICGILRAVWHGI